MPSQFKTSYRLFNINFSFNASCSILIQTKSKNIAFQCSTLTNLFKVVTGKDRNSKFKKKIKKTLQIKCKTLDK